MRIPAVDPVSGKRQTINSNIGPDQLLWNFRSAYNVAALNCLRPEHAAILENYKSFIKVYAKPLATANKGVDKQFDVAKGKANTRLREAYMTQVYNFYALPPTLPAFCDAVLTMSTDLQALPVTPGKVVRAPSRGRAKAAAAAVPEGSAKALNDFAGENLPKLDRVFLDFFNSYDQYRTDLAAWQARYEPAPPAINPAAGPVAGAQPVTTTGVPAKP